jgi:hypothetical protein
MLAVTIEFENVISLRLLAKFDLFSFVPNSGVCLTSYRSTVSLFVPLRSEVFLIKRNSLQLMTGEAYNSKNGKSYHAMLWTELSRRN